MHKATRSITVSFVIAMLLAFAAQGGAASLGGQVLETAGVGLLVSKFAGPLDKFINTVTLRHGVGTRLATKVVPILSVGEKGYVGGAQVCGPAVLVSKTQAVFQYEKNFSNNNYRAKVLVPSSSLNPLSLARVPKVGVSAIIDVSLDGSLRHQTVGTGIHAGDVIRGAGVLIAIKNLGPQINQGLNAITFNKGYVTKFVPWASIGEKMYLGGAQVSGAASQIGSAQAVWQYEDLFLDGKFRVKVAVPTNSTNPLKMARVDGAGVTAVVDMAASQQEDLQAAQQRKAQQQYGVILASPSRPAIVYERHDNGKHKGWYKGKHKGREKNDRDKRCERGD